MGVAINATQRLVPLKETDGKKRISAENVGLIEPLVQAYAFRAWKFGTKATTVKEKT